MPILVAVGFLIAGITVMKMRVAPSHRHQVLRRGGRSLLVWAILATCVASASDSAFYAHRGSHFRMMFWSTSAFVGFIFLCCLMLPEHDPED